MPLATARARDDHVVQGVGSEDAEDVHGVSGLVDGDHPAILVVTNGRAPDETSTLQRLVQVGLVQELLVVGQGQPGGGQGDGRMSAQVRPAAVWPEDRSSGSRVGTSAV